MVMIIKLKWEETKGRIKNVSHNNVIRSKSSKTQNTKDNELHLSKEKNSGNYQRMYETFSFQAL